MPRIARWLEDRRADVVGLQEVWRGATAHLSLDDLLFPGRADGDSGLALVTPHPATAPEVTHFQRARGFDALKRKGALTSRVEVPGGGDVWVVVTHLQAGAGERAARVRSTQVEQLVDLVGHLRGPAVVLGDFNLHDDSATDSGSRGRLEAVGLVDAAVAVGTAEPTYRGSTQRFDRIYLRHAADRCLRPLSAAVLEPEEDALSDHFPVEVTLGVVGTLP